MLYVARFSFSREPLPESVEPEPWHGYCTCVAEAGSIDEALEKFKALLHELRNTEDVFDDLQEIYLDACVKIRSTPPASGFLAHYSEQRGEHQGEISTCVRGAGEDQAVAYYLGREDREVEDQTSTDEPFVVFP